jgi:hypothetical protein
MSDAAAAALASNPTFGHLSTLVIFSEAHKAQTITGKGLESILTSRNLSNLKHLTLNGEDVDGTAALLRDPVVLPKARTIQVGVSWKVGVKIEQVRPGLSVR